MSDIDLLPRADIPVLFNDFKCKADAVWAVVDTLVVTDVSQELAVSHDTTVAVSTQILLSHRGRVVEAVKDPGCCGVASLQTHLEQCADPTSWVHASLQSWVKLGIENPENPK